MLRKDFVLKITFSIPLSSYPTPFPVFLTFSGTRVDNYVANFGSVYSSGESKTIGNEQHCPRLYTKLALL